ncbi:MAG: phage major capsid protein [Acidimicrobiia bacterium]
MNEIKVKIRETGEIETIHEDAFDEALHERIDEGPDPAEDLVTVSREELARVAQDAAREATEIALREAGVGVIDRGQRSGRVPSPDDLPTSRVTVTPGWEREWDRQSVLHRANGQWSEAMAAVRTKEGDWESAEFIRALATGDRQRVNEIVGDYARVMGEATVAAGGALTPPSLQANLVIKREETARVRPRAQRYTATGETTIVPRETNIASVGKVAESAAPATETSITFAEVTLVANKIMGITRSSRELFDDSIFSLVEIVSRKFGSALAIYEDDRCFNNTGSDITEGVFENADVNEVDAAVGVLAIGDVVALVYGVGDLYIAPGSSFFLNTLNAERMTNLADSNGRRHFDNATNPIARVAEGSGAGVIGNVMGFPVVRAPTPDARILFGNLNGYAFFDKETIRIEASTEATFEFGATTESLFTRDQIGWKVVERFDGAVQDGFQLAYLDGITG